MQGDNSLHKLEFRKEVFTFVKIFFYKNKQILVLDNYKSTNIKILQHVYINYRNHRSLAKNVEVKLVGTTNVLQS